MKIRIFLSSLTLILFSLLGCASIKDNGYIVYSLWFLVIVGFLFIIFTSIYAILLLAKNYGNRKR